MNYTDYEKTYSNATSHLLTSVFIGTTVGLITTFLTRSKYFLIYKGRSWVPLTCSIGTSLGYSLGKNERKMQELFK